jgi:hypothetical protein
MTVQLSKERLGEIALAVLIKRMAVDDNIPSAQTIARGAPDEAKKLGIKPEEALAFLHYILPEVIRVRLGCESVTLQWPVTPTANKQ